ncbi:MAG: M16 family metallopeptidase [Treponema sp.]
MKIKNKKNGFKFSSLVLFCLFAINGIAVSKEYKVYESYKLNSGTVNEYRLKNEIPVYINSEVQNQVAAVYIIVTGGTAVQPAELSGLESSLFEMMTYGSKSYSYDKIQSLEYSTQSSVSHYTMYCGSAIYLNCINYYLGDMLPVLLDGFLNPSFKQKEYQMMMNDIVQDLQHCDNDPESILMREVHNQVYKGHPLYTSASVEHESLENITIENMKKHHKEILDSSRIKVVAVGKFDVQSFVSTLDNALGKLKPGKNKISAPENPPLNFPKEKTVLYHKDAKGAEMAVRVFASPAVTSEDYAAARIAEDIFSTIMFNVIREKYGACYTPGSQIESCYAPVGIDYGLRVSDMKNFSRYLKEAQDIMLAGKVISSASEKGMTFDSLENSLEGYKNSYIIKKYSSQSTSSGIASRIVSSILQFGDLTSADKIPQKALDVTKDDVLRVFKKYWIDGESSWFEMRGE